ncbi:MAG: hypothetical protein ACLPJH_00135 [Myxococcaceae bacterium]
MSQADGIEYRKGQGGRLTAILRRRSGGRRYVIKLPVASEAEAVAELRLVEAMGVPQYVERARTAAEAAARRKGGSGSVWSAESLRAWAASMAGRGVSQDHRRACLAYVKAWGRSLKHADLAKLATPDVRRALNGWRTARKYRVIALKAFTKHLRREGLLDRGADPTIELEVPAAKSNRALEDRAYPVPVIEAVYSHLSGSQEQRDMFRVLATTGMHISELARLAAGKGVVKAVSGQGAIAGTVKFTHKNGRPHVLSLDRATYDAAERLASRGSTLAKSAFQQGLHIASRGIEALKGADFAAGRLRHSFATHANGEVHPVNHHGVSRATIAAALGHSEATNRKFYAGIEVPAMVTVPYRLFHADDPPASLGGAWPPLG